MTALEREQHTDQADALCREAFAAAFPEAESGGVALAAVGGYGRRELAPYSDLDVVLLHDDAVELGEGAAAVWYPLWDSGRSLDHAVRASSDLTSAARQDVRVALGLLDLRPLAGDVDLVRRARSTVLADWRRGARERLPQLRDLSQARHARFGELAHVAVPDLKESMGGLRDAGVLKALVASWLVDVPHTELEVARRHLLDVRDVVQSAACRASDRVTPELWSAVAEGLGLADAEEAHRYVRGLGRRVTHLSRLTWRRVDAVLANPANLTGGPRRPRLTPLAPGVALAGGEVVLDGSLAPDRDPLLLVRAAAEAAERGVGLAPASVARLIRESPPMAEPWSAEARNLWVRLLGAGDGLPEVWETLEETGAITVLMPEWESIRLVPHASAIHRFTVDRHVVETCREAATLIRQTPRPDLLLVAALLHDIGKGHLGHGGDHSEAGAPIAHAIALRWGFVAEDAAIIATLVRHHLTLATLATTRDPDDPATAQALTAVIGDPQVLDLLALLTQADARAASSAAWTSWRAGLVRRLLNLAKASLDGVQLPRRPPGLPTIPQPLQAGLTVTSDGAESLVTVIEPDRVGLLADIAAVLAMARLPVRSVRVETVVEGDCAWGCSVWRVAGVGVDARVLRERLVALVEGRIDPSVRLSAPRGFDAEVRVHRDHDTSGASILEVRGSDRLGLLWVVLSALSTGEFSVRFAQIDTIGPQAVDILYLEDSGGATLSAPELDRAATTVSRALEGSAESGPPG